MVQEKTKKQKERDELTREELSSSAVFLIGMEFERAKRLRLEGEASWSRDSFQRADAMVELARFLRLITPEQSSKYNEEYCYGSAGIFWDMAEEKKAEIISAAIAYVFAGTMIPDVRKRAGASGSSF